MRSLLLLALAALVPATASAQSLFRAPIVGRGGALVSASAHDTVADVASDGATIAAVHFDSDVAIGGRRVRSLDAGRTVALARVDRHGRAQWVRAFAEEAGAGQPHVRSVARVEALSDGGALIGGTFGHGGDEQGVLARIGADGRTRWMLRPTRTTDWSRFVPVVTPRGTVMVLGNFFQGTFQLPGTDAWQSRQRFTAFLAEIDLETGGVRWARRIGGEGRAIELAADGGVLVAGQFQRFLRVGRTTLRGQGERDVFVARFDVGGAPIDAVAYGTAAEDHPRGLVATSDGGFAVLTSSGAAGAERYHLVGFDAEAERAFEEALGSRAFLARTRGPGPIVVGLPGRVHQVRIRNRPYSVVDQVQLVRFSSRGSRVSQRPMRFGGVGLLVRSLHARSVGDYVGVSGALTAGRGTSESFNVWTRAPEAPRAVAATVGSVL